MQLDFFKNAHNEYIQVKQYWSLLGYKRPLAPDQVQLEI